MHHHHPLAPTQSNTGGASTSNNASVPALPNVGSINAGIGTAIVNNTSTSVGTTHVQQRRRKKRPNYGTRTVEVRRGYNGFGFTISGQQPCRLSCIVSNSPADQAGLRAGDFLISVNGLNVSKLPHETVVQLIGNSFGSIRMQIAENYYSDSSDEENAALMLQQQTTVSGLNSVLTNQLGLGVGGARAKPRYLHHKAKMHRLRNSPQKKRTVTLQQQQQLARAEQLSKCVSALKPMELQKLRPLIEDLPLPSNSSAYVAPSVSAPKEPTAGVAAASNSAAELANVNAMARAPAAALEYRAIVGYLGTIEMPKQISHSSKLQTVRSCIRKLRQEKRQPNMVLMTILPDCLRLQAANGNTLASYASERLNYVSSSSESENRFFGLVTSAVHTSQMDEDDEDDDDIEAANVRNGQGVVGVGGVPGNNGNAHVSISNSCHVFVVDTKLCEHQAHVPRAAEFRIHCTRDPISSLCLEFPNNSEYVVNLIRSMYTMRIMPPVVRHHAAEDIVNGYGGVVAGGPAAAAHSPQPSNHSEISTTTSNSDSGIGFHNDCNNISDRILVVDFPGAPELRMRPMGARPMGIFNNFDNVTDKRPPTVRAVPEENSPPQSVDVASTSNAHCANSRPNLLANFNLIKSPATSLQTTRSCDDVLALVERSADDGETAALDQQSLIAPHASMDDISLHSSAPSASTMSCSAADEHLFLHPAACMLAMQHQKQRPTASQVYALLQDCLSRARNARQSLPSAHTTTDGLANAPNSQNGSSTGATAASTKRHSIGFEASDITPPVSALNVGTFETNTWKSLQDLRENQELRAPHTPDGINSEPDLLNSNLPANASPFRRAWGQSSFRTPRTDKRALQQLQLQQQSGQHQHLSPLVRRSSSMTASDNDVYIKSMHHTDCHDELKQTHSQHQIATSAAALVAARNTNAVAATTLTTTNATSNSGNSKVASCINQLKIPQLKTTLAPSADNGVGGVAAWGTAFERLLEDPAGMHTFAEFLKKEFSAENIYFWTACERYRALESSDGRAAQAMAIFSKHLANGALEPVNVDSQARNLTQEKLESAEPDIFAPAQKQIFNLMKFDSYQRFIRSDMYKSCVEAEEKRQPLPYKAEDLDELLRTPAHQPVTVSSIVSKLKKSASNAEDRCRKSLLPWHRKTSSSKAPRDNTDAPTDCKATTNKIAPLSSHSLKLAPVQNSQNDIHSSRSSLSSFDGLPGASILPGTCRVILSDASTTMVQARANETVGQLVERLLEKRGLCYQYYDVVAKGTTKSIDLQTSSQTLVGKDVLIEQRVAFKMDLPDRKVISVKSKPKKQLQEVVCPILHKYNYDIEAVQVVMRETQEPVDLSLTVTHADGQRLQAVWLKPPPLLHGNDYQNGNGCAAKVAKASTSTKSVSFPTALKQTNGGALRSTSSSSIPVSHSTQSALDEITNKVFTELMQVKVEAASAEKTQPLTTHNDKVNEHASLKSDDCASETSSIFERIRRRDNNIQSLKLKLKKRSTSSQHSEETNQSSHTTASNGQLAAPTAVNAALLDIKKPIIAKLKAGVKLQMPERVAENQDELLEGLKRAQLARLEDQRGTEINFELPDFLKNKENLNASKLRKARANLSPINKPPAQISVAATEEQPAQTAPQPTQQERPQPAPRLSITNKLKANATVSSAKQEQLNTDEARQTQPTTPLSANLTTTSLESEYAAALVGTNSCKGPPPLPPKPKVLPIKPSNWGAAACMSNSSTASTPTTPSTSIPTLPTPLSKNYTTVGLTNSVTTIVEDAPLLLHVASKHFSGNEIAPRKTHLSIAAEQPTSARCAYLEEPSSSFV
ncbi:regulator of G-protein signaling loco isoform X1 [Bactrocera dorsalis]|uniref:Regulator of G-protein signaling loco isoform X1 n=1 Tax=Bactrocera dorsalis TaxID=27457 RepID=A0A6I9VHT4_BACDO|nr:regulator of G-protein signaling loco isoform X1 [Bactrocera dorsalis]XP_049305212.1 regulator of G-protein signaling loco isoform X1 [Bactrocera dorsalis]